MRAGTRRCRCSSESYATNPAQPGSYRIGLFLYHYAHGRYRRGAGRGPPGRRAQVLYGHVAVAAAAAELGLDDEAADAVAAIRALDPDYGAHVVADLESRHVAPDLVPLIVAGLEKAGLPIAAPGGGPGRLSIMTLACRARTSHFAHGSFAANDRAQGGAHRLLKPNWQLRQGPDVNLWRTG